MIKKEQLMFIRLKTKNKIRTFSCIQIELTKEHDEYVIIWLANFSILLFKELFLPQFCFR